MEEYINTAIGYVNDYPIITENKIVFAILIIIAAFVLGVIVTGILKILTSLVAKRTESELDDEFLKALEAPVFRIIVLGALVLSVGLFELSEEVGDLLEKILVTLMYVTGILFAANVANIAFVHGFSKIAERTESDIDDEILPIAKNSASVIVWLFGLVLILGVWGVDITPFIAGIGIAGLAISFALQESLGNIFGGISIILDKTYKAGDKIQIDSGEAGHVLEVGLRSTRIKTFDNEVIIVPNGKMASSKIKNYVQPDTTIRVNVKFGVEYGTDPNKVKSVIEPVLAGIKGIMEDPVPKVEFLSMGESSLDCVARFWVPHHGDAYSKQLEATDLIYKELNKAKIGIPFPTRTVYMKK